MFAKNKNVLLLISRLIIGGVFLNSGWMKISAMTETINQFQTMGIPAFLTYIVSYAELIGGVLVILGLFMDIATLVLAMIMFVAVYLTRSLGFQVYSMPLTVLAGLLPLMASGPGTYSFSLKREQKIVANNGL